MGSTIIGIDHGYKNMKSANAMFATRLSRMESKPDEMQMDGVVEFEGVYYTIYGSPLAAVNNHIKSEREEYYLLTLAFLGEEFRARGIQPGPNKIHVRLGCGLPQKWYDRQKESFKAMLWKNKELRFSYCGNTYNVVIDNVTVYMQGFAALPVLECIPCKSEHVVLVDIGGETVDVIVCEGFHPFLDKCRIDTRATIALLKDIDSELQSELGETIPEQDIIKYICRGSKDVVVNNPYEEIMQRCLCKYADYIFTRLKEWGVNTNYTTICFLGGGGRIIQSFGNYGKESYVAACALAILKTKADACSQDDFIRNMKQKGWHVIWKPSRKNITFVNEEGKKVRDRNILKTFNINVTKGELLDEFIRNNERRNGVQRDDEEERIRTAAEDAELAGYYQQVQDALEGTVAGDSAEGFEDFTAGEVALGERRSIREALATKGRAKGMSGAEDRKREEQLPVPEQQAKRNRRRAR